MEFKFKLNLKIKPVEITRKAALFLAGSVLLAPLYLGIHSPNFAIKRFRIPESSVDLFVSKMNSSVQMGYFLGLLVACLFIAFYPKTQRLLNNISVGLAWLSLLSLVAVLVSYVVSGEDGAPSLFFSTVTIASFVFSAFQAFVFNVGGSDIHWYAGAIPFSGFALVGYQLIYLYFAYALDVVRVELWIIVVEITLFIVATLITAVLWTAGFVRAGPEPLGSEVIPAFDSNFFADVMTTKRPIVMTVVGLGYLYICYPAIMPFKLANIDLAYRVDLACITLCCVVSILVCFVCEFSGVGPNKSWSGAPTKWRHAWLVCVPYLLWPLMFVLPLHYPNWKFSRAMLNNVFLMGALGLAYIFMHTFITTVGYSSVPMQTCSVNTGLVATVNTLVAYFVMNVVIMYSQGYLRLYAVYSKNTDGWPTNSMNWFSAMFYWIGKSFVEGWKGFAAGLSRDIRKDILNL